MQKSHVKIRHYFLIEKSMIFLDFVTFSKYNRLKNRYLYQNLRSLCRNYKETKHSLAIYHTVLVYHFKARYLKGDIVIFQDESIFLRILFSSKLFSKIYV